MKKIALLISSLNSGGAERVVSHLSKILKQDYFVYVILFDASEVDYDYEGSLIDLRVPAQDNLFLKIKLLFQRIKRLKDFEIEEHLDCVISFLDSPNFVNLLAKTNGCKRIISIRNYSGLENRATFTGQLINWGMKYLYRKADVVVAVSRKIEQELSKNYKIPNGKIKTIYNPYNFEQIEISSQEGLHAEEYNYLEKSFIYMNVSRLMYQKGIWHLLKAFSIVHQKISSAKLLLVGEDLSNGKVMKLIQELNLEKSVWLTGRVKNPYKYMARSDVYVLTSLFEGFPNSMVEAMACGCAVIAADCLSGPREILFHEPDLEKKYGDMISGDYGLLVPAFDQSEDWSPQNITRNEEVLAEAMMELYFNQSKLKDLQKKARNRSRDFSFSECKRNYCKIIEDTEEI